MRYPSLFLLLAVSLFTAKAQQLTASELISKVTCKDTACYQAMLTGKGFVAMPSYIKSARVVNYTQKTVDCVDSKGSKSYALFTVENWPKGLAFKLTTMCVDTYDKLLGEFTAEGFKADMNTTTAPTAGEVIKTAKYTSAKHKGMVLYAGKGDKNGKSYCIVRLMVE